MRVLLVEDNAAVAEVTAELLADAGHVVTVALDFAKAATALAAAPPPEALIADIDLGGRQSGRDLAAQARPLGIPVLLATGHPDHVDSRAGRRDDFLAKPYRIDALLDWLELVRVIPETQDAGR